MNGFRPTPRLYSRITDGFRAAAEHPAHEMIQSVMNFGLPDRCGSGQVQFRLNSDKGLSERKISQCGRFVSEHLRDC